MANLPQSPNYTYPGNELDTFACAKNWKSYFAARIRPFLRGDVLEVGSGLGVNIPYLLNPDVASWMSLEPDGKLFDAWLSRQNAGEIPPFCEIRRSKLKDMPSGESFDAILYIDVMEHIENDAEEFAHAFSHVRPGGSLVVLSPAHNILFSPFDAAVGHHRRYNKSMFLRLSPHRPSRIEYLDSVGVMASLANMALLKDQHPSVKQIRIWDGIMIPGSKVLDRLFFRRVGKTILGIWSRMTPDDTG